MVMSSLHYSKVQVLVNFPFFFKRCNSLLIGQFYFSFIYLFPIFIIGWAYFSMPNFKHMYWLYILNVSIRVSNYHYYYYCLLLESLSDSKFPHVSRTVPSILSDFNNVVIWMISTRPLISKSSCPFINPSVTVPTTPITIDINVSFMFCSFSIPL